MSAMTNDRPTGTVPGPAAPRAATGLALALVSAVSFGLSGALARPMLDVGWSPGAVVLVRIALGAVVVVPFGVSALRGRWFLLRREAGTILLYGVMAVAGAQFCYFAAIQYLQVGPALLIEYTAPAAVVVWLWLRHGQRPGAVTLAGAAVAVAGLVLVLDVFSAGADLSVVGVLWAFGAMAGAATYFVISADERTGLPPMALASGGLVVGATTLALLGVVGLLPMTASAAPVAYAGVTTSWWVPLLLLGLVTAAVPYTTGIAAGRRLGSRVASFVGLSEVLAAVLWAWLLLGELPSAVQLAGGVLVLLGVIGVKLGERSTERVEPVPA